MSHGNPYAPAHPSKLPQGDIEIRKVPVRVISLLRRAFDLIRDQYWLFLGITLLGLLIGSAVPLGLVMGHVLVGIYSSYLERERKGRTEFQTMFIGFENFLEPLLAYLIILAVGLVILIPFMVVMMVIVMVPIIAAAQSAGPGNQPEVPATFFVMFLILYPLMIAVSLLSVLPFLFTFQLMADRNLRGIDAIKLSIRGVLANFWGVLWCLIALSFISFLAALMCYFPVFLLMPLTFGAMYLLYRDIYGPPPELPDDVLDAQVVS